MNTTNPIFCLLLAALLLLTGCTQKPKRYVIGVSQCSEDIWRDKLNNELKTGEYLNDSIQVRLASSNDDSKKQIRQINQLVDEGVDLLVVSPNQLSTVSKAISRAYDKGIPVILYDRKTNSDKYTAFIGCDNYAIGQSMGHFIAARLKGKGRIVEIRGLEGSSPAMERHRGFKDAVKAYPGLKVVASEAGNWKEESGAKAMRRILSHTRDFDYVFAHNDRMAWGACQAARQAGLRRSYRYTGVDGLASPGGGLEMVRDGVFEASYVYPTKGDEVIALAMKILRHQPYKRDNYLHTSIVTRDNAERTLMEAKDSERQQKNLDLLHHRVDQYLSDYQAQKLLLVGLVIFLVVIMMTAVLLFRNYVIKTRLNEQLALKNEELKQLNEQLAQKNEELKRLNEEVMELTHSRLVFFTNISHELRTPLTLIADPVELLLANPDIKGRSRNLLQMVQRNAQALQQLVGSILDFRKIQNGKMQLRLHRFDLAGAIRLWTGDFQLTAERKHIHIHTDTTGFTPPTMVVADQEKMARIVFNLLSNALKYTPQGGDIYVTLQDTDGGRLRLSVRDTGQGIAKEEAPKVFERFFQAKGASGGTGIGLALVKSFAELHHGSATVESDLGQGADFIVTMPRTQEGPIEPDRSDNTATPLSPADDNIEPYLQESSNHEGQVQRLVSEQADRPTLLIIDDNNDVRQYERTLLQDTYIVLEATNGQEGLETARREVPDLIICDVMMPVMDGLELTQRLKTDTATSHIPVILLTAKNMEEQRAEGYAYGADSYITKPFSNKVLLARIDNLLKQRTLLKDVYKGSQTAEQEIDASNLDNRDKLFMSRLHDIIQRHLTDTDFGVEEIGHEIGLSRVQLYRKVKAMTGTSVVDLLRKARLARARRLLEARKGSVSEVAYAVGFSSPSYFTKCFKEEFGMLPGEVAP